MITRAHCATGLLMGVLPCPWGDKPESVLFWHSLRAFLTGTGKGRGSRGEHLPVLGLSLLHQQDLCHLPAGWRLQEVPCARETGSFPSALTVTQPGWMLQAGENRAGLSRQADFLFR